MIGIKYDKLDLYKALMELIEDTTKLSEVHPKSKGDLVDLLMRLNEKKAQRKLKLMRRHLSKLIREEQLHRIRSLPM